MHRHHGMRRWARRDFDAEGMRHAWRHGWRGRRRAGRMFNQADLRFVILRLIQERPRHGYEIIKAIEEAFGGAYSPSPGIVYPALAMLEEMGYAAASVDASGKKPYAITKEGAAFLAESKAEVDALHERIAAIRNARGGGPPAPVIRAMENLRLALRLRLDQGELDEAKIAAIAAALDAAAQAVERA